MNDFQFLIHTVFHHEPAGVRESGDFKGEAYDEFYWRSCAGEQNGYLMIWLDSEGNLSNTFHTYHYPPDVY